MRVQKHDGNGKSKRTRTKKKSKVKQNELISIRWCIQLEKPRIPERRRTNKQSKE